MKIKTLTLEFSTPAFLGNAEQSGAWRTPPIKALLRQWWRMAYASQLNFQLDVSTLRQEEAILFGHADNDGANRSLVRLRLERWDGGKLARAQWQALAKTDHPEVKNRSTGKPQLVGSDLYLGYGPLEFAGGQTQLKKNAAIQAGESAGFRLACPERQGALLEQALGLMDRYGTLGGRSRNGWGSFSLTPTDNTPLTGTLPLRNWKECLDRDWPHAIGSDEKGALIWQTHPQTDWKRVMVELAKLKIGLRTQFAFTTGRNAPKTEARHWLSYPVTNHTVANWGNNLRLPNSLRFKVRPVGNGQFAGVIFHVPCLPPSAFHPDRGDIEAVWQRVHPFLDAPQNSLSRIQE
jgi:CRISPR-associated protein Cmr1